MHMIIRASGQNTHFKKIHSFAVAIVFFPRMASKAENIRANSGRIETSGR